MKIRDYRGYEIHFPTTGGNAGQGNNKTGSIQVRQSGRLLKQFRYEVILPYGRGKAEGKATAWIDARVVVTPVIKNKNGPDIVRLIRVDFDSMENDVTVAIRHKTVGLFIEADTLSAHGVLKHWLAKQAPVQVYLGWDGQIYPQWLLVKDPVQTVQTEAPSPQPVSSRPVSSRPVSSRPVSSRPASSGSEIVVTGRRNGSVPASA